MSPMLKTGAWVNQSLTQFSEIKYWPDDSLSTASQSSFTRVAMWTVVTVKLMTMIDR